jgi:hypothetical protein
VTKLFRLTAALLVSLLISLPSASAAGPVSINDTARYLAGLEPAPDSPLMALTQEPGWRSHARTLDRAWQRLEKRQLAPIRAWSNKHLQEHRDFMLYMFSGPDFLYADAFYPHASTYVLSALEPVGAVPDLTKMSRGARGGALSELRGSMQTVLSYSFFITKQMKSDLKSGSMRGTLPLLYVFLARAGNTIDEVTRVSLNPDGTVVPQGEQTAKGASSGVKITFTGNQGKKRTLYYFRTDLSNGGLAKSGFRKFCAGFGPADSLVKSASYLMHGSWFSKARDFLLAQSAVLIQDDSGIPLRYFTPRVWTLYPFGQYLGPISIFAKHYQKDMKRLFAGGRAKKIDFGIGYMWRTHQTNVLLAVKKPVAAKEPKKEEAEAKKD